MQAAILAGSPDSVREHLRAGARADRETLFGVYAHAYVARLAGVLKADYPILAAYAGDAVFNEMARDYIATSPSRHSNARWFGAGLADYLAGTHAQAPLAVYAELASLEWALGLAFDAEDAQALTFADIALIPPEDWSDLVFAMQPSARLFRETCNVFEIWSALKDGTLAPPAARLPEPRDYLIWRHDVTPRIRLLAPEEAMLWREAAQGYPFGRLCELAALFDDPLTAPARVASVLRGWLETGIVRSAQVAAAAADGQALERAAVPCSRV